MDRGTIIRSAVQPDLGHILHSRHQYHWHTGYVPPQTVAAPHIGAWISKILGPRNPAIPAFIDVGQRLEGVGEKEELKAFHTAGFLGSEYGPFLLPYPDQAMAAVRPPKGMTPERFERRYKYYRELVKRSPIADQASEYQQESTIRSMENAYRLLSSPERVAFDLSLEPKESYENLQHESFRTRLFACAAVGRSGGSVHRGNFRVCAVCQLGHAREWTHDGREDEKGYQPADCSINLGP